MSNTVNTPGDGEPQLAFLRVLVEGLSPSLIDDFITSETARRRAQRCSCHAHHTVTSTLGCGKTSSAVPTSPRKKCVACRELHRGMVHFALIGALPALGAWGRRSALVLRPSTDATHTDSPQGDHEEGATADDRARPRAYVGYTTVPVDQLTQFQYAGQPLTTEPPPPLDLIGSPFTGRLVLVELDKSAEPVSGLPAMPGVTTTTMNAEAAAALPETAVMAGEAAPPGPPLTASVQGHDGAPSAAAVLPAPLPWSSDDKAAAVAAAAAVTVPPTAGPAPIANVINRILAVDNRQTHPDILPLRLIVIKTPHEATVATSVVTPSTAVSDGVDVDLGSVDLAGLGEIDGFLVSGSLWEAKLNVGISVRQPVHFTSTPAQFPFLRTLSPSSPSELRAAFIRSIGANAAALSEENTPLYKRFASLLLQPEDLETQPGPLVSLTFFGNDPRLPFDYNAWLARQAPSVQAALAALAPPAEATSSTTSTSPHQPLVRVVDVRPIPLQGSEWCEVDLPTAAPLKKLQKSRRREQLLRHERERQKRLAEEGATPGPTRAPGSTTAASVNSTTAATAAAAAVVSAAASRTAAAKSATGGTRLAGATASEGIGPSASRPASLELSTYSEPGHESSEDDELDGGGGAHPQWCVRPLRMSEAVSGPGLQAARSQPCWNIVANLTHLGERAVGVTVEVPVLHHTSQQIYWARGEVVVVSSMLRANTSGTLQLPVYCRLPSAFFADAVGSSSSLNSAGSGNLYGTQSRAPGEGGVWVTLFAQYLVVYAYNHDLNDLRCVRSAESYDRLTIPTLIGHRGLGKTYTRSGEKRALTMKLAENSIESFNAAHRRGCDAIEFDVMLTLDRVPIIFHDPILMLQARERQRAPPVPSRADVDGFFADVELRSGDASPSVNASMVNPYGLGDPRLPGSPGLRAGSLVPAGARHRPGLLTPFQRHYLDYQSFFSPIPVAIHTLTQRQLEVVATEAFRFGKAQDRLKTLLLRHWNRILRVYRNRSRLQCLRDHSLVVRPSDKDVFRGCAEIPTSRSDGSPEGPVGESLASRPRYADPILGVMPLTTHQTRRTSAHAVVKGQEDITNHIPALHELFEFTPTSLRLNIEVKFPFMPKWDVNLFQQTDAFEINGFVDAILDVVFAYAQDEREIVFSSFEPDICLALSLKQSRYDVIFLSDTEEREDLKDYRSFYIEGALQFAHLHHLSGVSINAATLSEDAQKAWSSTPTPSIVAKQKERQITADVAALATTTTTTTTTTGTATKASTTRATPLDTTTPSAMVTASQTQVPLVADLDVLSAVHGDRCPDQTQLSERDRAVCQQYAERWQKFDPELGRQIVAEAHARHLKVFTWGDNNSEYQFAYVQGTTMKVDGVITDHVPLWPVQAPREHREEL